MSDSSDVDAVLVAKLQADVALTALMPDGVWVDEAPPGLKRYVHVSLIDEHDGVMFEGRSDENALYLVEARALSTVVGPTTMKAAAARIDALLHLGTLLIPGYTLQVMRRTERTRMTDVDAADTSLRFYHRGGRYQVKVAPDEP